MILTETISGKISNFVVSFSYNDLPDDVIAFAKLLLLDLLGASLAGVNTDCLLYTSPSPRDRG